MWTSSNRTIVWARNKINKPRRIWVNQEWNWQGEGCNEQKMRLISSMKGILAIGFSVNCLERCFPWKNKGRCGSWSQHDEWISDDLNLWRNEIISKNQWPGTLNGGCFEKYFKTYVRKLSFPWKYSSCNRIFYKKFFLQTSTWEVLLK